MNDTQLFGEYFIYDTIVQLDAKFKRLDINGDVKKYTQRLISRLEPYIDDADKHEGDEEDENKKILTDDDKDECLSNIHILFSLISSYLNRQIIFNAVKECSLDKDCLRKLSNKENSAFFDDAIWNNLSELAKSDYSDAAKCILMGASTPAAMIALRASEDTVRHYYAMKTSEDPGKKNWGPIITELKRLPDKNIELLEHLDYVRKTRRNLAQHPDKVYNQREAERIFMDVVSMVHDIYEDIE